MRRHVPLALCLVIFGAAACSKGADSGAHAGDPSRLPPAPASLPTNVPFVGCPADGQTGPRPAPIGGLKQINIDPAIAPRLAWYASPDVAVLAPRGWYCFEAYGSSGNFLVIAPTPLRFDTANPSKLALAVVVGVDSGGTSGRFAVAQVIARVFPDRAAFVRSVIAEGIEPPSDFPSGPYPSDQMTTLGADALAYHTPAETGGLGTLAGGFNPSDQVIDGVVFLSGADTDLAFLAVRLPADLQELGPAIIQAYEQTNLPKGASSPLAAVQGFYGALANGDGTAASGFVIEAKRAAVPLSADALSKYYGALATPLTLGNAAQQPNGSVEVRYAYANPGGRRCDGAAVVTTVASGSAFLISGIKALNGC